MLQSFHESTTKATFHLSDETSLKLKSSQAKYYTFIWATTHEIILSIDNQKTKLLAGQILAITPFHHFTFVSGSNARVFQFNREFYCIKDHDKEVGCAGILFFGSRELPIINLDSAHQKKFEHLHNEFIEELNTEDTIKGEMLRVLMVRFIITLTRLIKNQSAFHELPKEKTELLRHYNVLVEAHFKKEHSVVFYATQLQRSPKTLSNYFAKFDSSPLQIIHNRIIIEAKRLLIYSDKSSKEIAFELGFEDPSHLSRMFKKHIGIPPSQFKKNNLKA